MTTRRLIEEELPLKVVNAESAREKSLRHGHISTLHLWWARRPLAMSRAVVFGTLLPDPGDPAARKEILDLLAYASSFEASTSPARIEPLRKLLSEAYPDGPPKVLDCFAGGGAIPLEALRLGCDVTAVDLNPVAHLIQRCTLEYPQRFGPKLAQDVVRWAGWVRDRVAPQLEAVFPAGETGRRPAVYFWARTMRCPNPRCRAPVPLLSSGWIANSSRRKAWVDINAEPGRIDLKVRTGPPPPSWTGADGTVRASSATCPGCHTTVPATEVRAYGKRTGFERLLYAVLDNDAGLRTYRAPTVLEVSGAELATALLDDLAETPDGTSALPDEAMVKSQYRRYGNLVYGIDTFRGLFNDRQLYVLGSLCQGVRDAHEQMLADGIGEEEARAIATYLGFLVDKISDYDSTFTSWATSGEFTRSTFARQAIAMVWDYLEVDPFHPESNIWQSHTRWIQLVLQHLQATRSDPPCKVERGNAQELTHPAGTFDAVIVDPPYYDAIQYGDLSDFFFVFLKRSIGHLYPTLFATPLTPKHQEVIESRADRKSPEHVSHEEFETRLQRALNEMARVIKPAGVVAIVFAHTDVKAWEQLLRALQAAGLVVSTSWPMRSEREARSTALISAVLGSSVVLVCRKQGGQDEGFYDDVVRELEARIAERLDAFEEMGLVGADYFVSAIGPAFEVFARYKRIVKLSGDEVDVSELMVLARQAVARHAMRRLLGPDSLATMDGESLFYLTWRWAYLTAAIPADEAYKLERAFDVDLGLLTRPGGIAKQSGSSFSLLGPHERRGLRLPASPPLIDVLHASCQLWEAGRRRELEELLGASGMGAEPSFWALARTLAEVVPEGDRERTMLLGLTGNRDALAEAAGRAGRSELLTLDLKL